MIQEFNGQRAELLLENNQLDKRRKKSCSIAVTGSTAWIRSSTVNSTSSQSWIVMYLLSGGLGRKEMENLFWRPKESFSVFSVENNRFKTLSFMVIVNGWVLSVTSSRQLFNLKSCWKKLASLCLCVSS